MKHYGAWAFFFLCAFFFSPLALTAEELGLEEISKTEAAKLYVAKKYDQSLRAFQALEFKHARNGIIKRYIASLYMTKRQLPEAESKLRESLELDSNDFIAKQMLGEVLIKAVKLQEARKIFEEIQTQDSSGNFKKHASSKIKDIDQVLHLREKVGKIMPVEEFMRSEGAAQFSKGKYEQALTNFDSMLNEYPDDALIYRFKGITLTRMGRYQEAIQIFQNALDLQPENPAIHYYLGQAYLEKNDIENARNEFRWVIAHDKDNYQIRAKRAIFQTLGRSPASAKKWTFSGSTGYEYDTNATYKSDDEAFSTAGDQNSGKYNLLVSGTYRFYQKKSLLLTADALYLQTIYNDFTRLNTYTPGFGVSALFGFKFFKVPSFLNIRNGATETILKNKYYTWSDSTSFSLISIPRPWYRTQLGYRFAVNQYNSNGSDPSFLSKDGFTNAVSAGATFYFNKAHTFFGNLIYEYERWDTTGKNNVKNVHSPKITINFPVYGKIQGEFSFRFKDSHYPHYATSSPLRRDDQCTLSAGLTLPFSEHTDLNAGYTFEDVRAKNNLYETTRHLFSIKMNVRY